MSIVAEAPGYLQVFSDGSVKRLIPGIVPASPDQPTNGYKSKDVVIDPSKSITGRLFIPADTNTNTTKLPLLVYYHGGGFCIGSTTWIGYHHFLGDFSVRSNSVVLSIDYRLAPEHRLPIAYDDCYTSLEWLTDITTEPWLNQADLSRVFLSGDSAGGNIAHNVAVKTVVKRVLDISIKGLLLIHPYFGSEQRTEAETRRGSDGHVKSNDMFWRLSIPEESNRDYYGCNFEKRELSKFEWNNFPAVVIYVAELDFLKERGVMYGEYLEHKGVSRVEIVETKGQSHVFHVFDPNCEATLLLQKHMTLFMESL